MTSLSHLLWIPAGAAVGFLASFVFGDLLTMPLDLYYLVYIAAVLGFLGLYAKRTKLDLMTWVRRRLAWGVVLGVLGGLILMRGVLAHPATPRLYGTLLAWALFWRGLVYGCVDGLLLLAFPWVVTWRALGAEEASLALRLRAGALALLAILFVTTTYHLGYRDFRSARILQPNIGAALAALPTLVAANPLGAPVSHVFLHVTAVLHSPGTDLFLPPHREAGLPTASRARVTRELSWDIVGDLGTFPHPLPERSMRECTASDVMAHPVITTAETTSLEKVARLMLDKDIGSVVVVDENDAMSGIVTDSDFAARKSRIPFSTFEIPQLLGQWMGRDGVEEIYRKAQSMEVGEIMTRRVLSVEEDTPVGEVVRLMLDRAIDHVPVVRDGKPVGMVTRWDLLKLLLRRESVP